MFIDFAKLTLRELVDLRAKVNMEIHVRLRGSVDHQVVSFPLPRAEEQTNILRLFEDAPRSR